MSRSPIPGTISSKIRNRFIRLSKRKVIPIGELAETRRLSSEMSANVMTYDRLGDYDPAHAVYIVCQNLVSVFAEHLSTFPEMKAYCKLAGRAEDLYIPQGPPISPLTGSYFTLWAFFDLTFGGFRETIGTCFLDLAGLLGVDDHLIGAAGFFQSSRMGIYEHYGKKAGLIELREMLTGKSFSCICPAGYSGRKRELWYVRILPSPIDGISHSVIMTTPYVLIGHSQKEWIDFFERHGISRSDPKIDEKLHTFMKHGESVHFWNEFIFEGYFNHRRDVIFLEGIPDLPETLPHSEDH